MRSSLFTAALFLLASAFNSASALAVPILRDAEDRASPAIRAVLLTRVPNESRDSRARAFGKTLEIFPRGKMILKSDVAVKDKLKAKAARLKEEEKAAREAESQRRKDAAKAAKDAEKAAKNAADAERQRERDAARAARKPAKKYTGFQDEDDDMRPLLG